MACCVDINVSQSNVATYARCGGIFNIHSTANLLRNFTEKKFLNRLRFDRNMVMSLWRRFFWPTLYRQVLHARGAGGGICDALLPCRCCFQPNKWHPDIKMLSVIDCHTSYVGLYLSRKTLRSWDQQETDGVFCSLRCISGSCNGCTRAPRRIANQLFTILHKHTIQSI